MIYYATVIIRMESSFDLKKASEKKAKEYITGLIRPYNPILLRIVSVPQISVGVK